jgi:hypothetical protein
MVVGAGVTISTAGARREFVIPVYFGPWAAIVRRGPRDILSCLSSATGKLRGVTVTRGSVWHFMPLCSVLKL